MKKQVIIAVLISMAIGMGTPANTKQDEALDFNPGSVYAGFTTVEYDQLTSAANTDYTSVDETGESEWSTGYTTTKINLRKESNTESDIVDVLDYNTEIQYADYDTEWVMVLYNNEVCYMSSEYVSSEKCKFESEPIYIRCTGYTDTGLTASGEYVFDGCAATCNAWYGKTINVYAVAEDGTVGELIGTYQSCDKGGKHISSGERIDIWFSSDAELNAFRDQYGDYVYIEILDII